MVKTYFRKVCRICFSNNLTLYLNLGTMPLAGDFLTKKEIGKEKAYNLRIYLCRNCGLMQVSDVINPDLLFRNYKYSSSVGLKNYFSEYAKFLINKKFLQKNDFAVEIGSNDGVFLMPLKLKGIKILGVEPSVNIAKIARKKGIETINDYFSKESANKILKKYGQADMITASNVMAHIDNLDDILDGIKLLLKPDGFFVMEVHYVYKLISSNQYDFFYNEHLCYFGVRDIVGLFKKFNMDVFKVMLTDLHGGSLRVFIKHKNSGKRQISSSVGKFLDKESSPKYVKMVNAFPEKVSAKIIRLRKLVFEINNKGGMVAGFGASGRANTIINSAGLSNKEIAYVVDESPLRMGKYLPGSHIPVKSLDYFLKDTRIIHCILFAWSYKKQILPKIRSFTGRGGKIIKP